MWGMTMNFRTYSSYYYYYYMLVIVTAVCMTTIKNNNHVVVHSYYVPIQSTTKIAFPVNTMTTKPRANWGTKHVPHEQLDPPFVLRTTLRMDNNNNHNEVTKATTTITSTTTATSKTSDLYNDNYTDLNEELDRILTGSRSLYVSSIHNETMIASTQQQSNSINSNSPLRQAIQFLQQHASTIRITKSNWDNIFICIEDMTAELASLMNNDINNNNNIEKNTAALATFPIQSTIRQDMTDMYQLLASVPLSSSFQIQQQQQEQIDNNATSNVNDDDGEPPLRLFGAVSTLEPPATFINPVGTTSTTTVTDNNNFISPQLFEQIVNKPLSSLTPSSSNILLYLGGAVAILEGIFSFYTGINFNAIVGTTLLLLLFDRILINGIIMETIFKVISPQLQQRIYHHEAGHLLCAYLLGCPIESIVVSAYAALQDPRYRNRNNLPSFTAGTSFFDPILSDQMNASIMPNNKSADGNGGSNTKNTGVTRSSIDRYSIIVMAGIAAEADEYGQADGGASDEYSLIAFLSQLRSNNKIGSSSNTWNSDTIRNQARYGALQAMLLLRQYRPAYDAIVSTLEYGGTLKDCIYAIEQAGRQYQLPTKIQRQPMGYIVSTPTIGTASSTFPSDISAIPATTWIPNQHNNTFINNFLKNMK